VLIAPDSFTGTLSAVQAAEAIAAGWRDTAPDDELILAPLSDGGPGFTDVLHACLGGELIALTVHGPRGELVRRACCGWARSPIWSPHRPRACT